MMVFAPPIHGKIYSFRLPVAFQKVNRVDILFLKGKYSIFKSERVDYDLKYCMETRFSKIRTSGSTKRNFSFEIFRSRLIEKFGEYTYLSLVRDDSEG